MGLTHGHAEETHGLDSRATDSILSRTRPMSAASDVPAAAKTTSVVIAVVPPVGIS